MGDFNYYISYCNISIWTPKSIRNYIQFNSKRIGSSKSTVAWITNLPIFLWFLLAPFISVLARKFYGYQLLSFIGVVLSVSALITSFFVNNIYWLFLTYGLLLGIGLFLLGNPDKIIICFYFEKHLSLMTSIVMLGGAAAAFLLAPFLNYTMEEYGWRNSYCFLGLLFFVICSPSCFLRKRRTTQLSVVTTNSNNNIKKDASYFISFKRLMKDKNFKILLLVRLIVCTDYLIGNTHLVQYCIELGIPRESVNFLPVYMGIGDITGRLFFGKLFDLKCINKLYAYQTFYLMASILALLGTLCKTYTHMIVYSMFYLMIVGRYKSQDTIMLRYVVGSTDFAEGFTLIRLFQSFKMLLGPVLVGFIVDQTNNSKSNFYCIAVPVFLSFVLLFW